MDLLALLAGFDLWEWLGITAGTGGWVGLTWWLGEFTEKRGGDRESGALIGFFVPGIIALVVWGIISFT
ncbi:hypothetical protein [Parendozoicomonas haliclonae]|uniref:Uncharacterized protein n=1 Tax=Parendozoicomonas haliclonae TaxID=1960125 RepID=A0A1X7AJ55_9GAMM|nr:hypothetical protein [Parendozoicomonas haliclonae]SMA44842.1 hypothetical protein EHSB41UT_01810 [Parendozoicomonas haliclonae]